MKSKRKMIAITVSLILVIACLAGATVAYFTDNESVSNVLTVGDVDIDLFESQNTYTATGSTGLSAGDITNVKADDADYADWLATEGNGKYIVPGQVVAKNTYIENTGANDAFVRFSVTVPKAFIDYVELKWNTTEFHAVTSKLDGEGNKVYQIIRKEALKPGEMTSNGLKSVNLIATMTSANVDALVQSGALADVNGTFNISVVGEAIQTVGFEAENEKSAAQVAFETYDDGTGI